MQVVSGLGREIPSPNGGAIRGAIQTDAAINAGKVTLINVHSVRTSTSFKSKLRNVGNSNLYPNSCTSIKMVTSIFSPVLYNFGIDETAMIFKICFVLVITVIDVISLVKRNSFQSYQTSCNLKQNCFYYPIFCKM